jgi:YHS domain-containing protein/uncharacterized membrane protein/mono/diheme cytochrome c family protein
MLPLFGRFHPLLVHLPIGLIVVLAFLELLTRFFPRYAKANASAGAILALAVPASVASAVCGWLLSLGGGYEADLLQWHKWTGTAVAALCAVLGLMYWLDFKKAYRLGLGATCLVLVWTSHFGGSLTHGKDYLARYAPGPLRALLGGMSTAAADQNKEGALADKRVFADVIRPVLDKNCIACHGPEKAKAGLRLDTQAGLLKGSENGSVVVAGKAAESALIKRIELPAEDEDHMPPAGKPQPSVAEIALLKWWVDAGAPDARKISELEVAPSIQVVLKKRFGMGMAPGAQAATPAQPKPLAEVLPLADKLTDDLNISIAALAEDEPWLQCNASIAGTNFSDTHLARLAPLALNLRWLDLAGTAVSDAGLAQVGAMHHLARLQLQRTAVTDTGLKQIAALSELEALNLYGTAVTDRMLESLKPLPNLRLLYLWQTQVTPEAAKRFTAARVDKELIAKWEAEIQRLQAQIHNQRMTVDLGAADAAATNSTFVPVNTICPVSCKLADRTRTTVHEGKIVAFCCDDCKATFLKDPKPHLARLAQFANPPPGNLGLAKPLNAKCPVSDKEIDPARTSVHDGKVVAFCCDKCKAKFDQEPTPFLAKLGFASTNSAPPKEPKQ